MAWVSKLEAIIAAKTPVSPTMPAERASHRYERPLGPPLKSPASISFVLFPPQNQSILGIPLLPLRTRRKKVGQRVSNQSVSFATP